MRARVDRITVKWQHINNAKHRKWTRGCISVLQSPQLRAAYRDVRRVRGLRHKKTFRNIRHEIGKRVAILPRRPSRNGKERARIECVLDSGAGVNTGVVGGAGAELSQIRNPWHRVARYRLRDAPFENGGRCAALGVVAGIRREVKRQVRGPGHVIELRRNVRFNNERERRRRSVSVSASEVGGQSKLDEFAVPHAGERCMGTRGDVSRCGDIDTCINTSHDCVVVLGVTPNGCVAKTYRRAVGQFRARRVGQDFVAATQRK